MRNGKAKRFITKYPHSIPNVDGGTRKTYFNNFIEFGKNRREPSHSEKVHSEKLCHSKKVHSEKVYHLAMVCSYF